MSGDNSCCVRSTTTANTGGHQVWRRKNIRGGLLAAAILGLWGPLWSSAARAQTNASWNVNQNGNWTTAADWTGGVFPSGSGATASLIQNSIVSGGSVTLNQAETVGVLNIGDISTLAATWTLAASNGFALTLDNGGVSATAHINAMQLSDNDIINPPLLLNSNLLVSSSATGMTLTIAGSINTTGGNQTITTAGAGNITFSGSFGGNILALNLTGNQTVTLSGVNGALGGSVALNAGQLTIGNALAFGSGTLAIGQLGATPALPVFLDASAGVTIASLPMTWNNDFFYKGTGNITQTAGKVTLAANCKVYTEQFPGSGTLAIDGPITGNFGISKYGGNMLTLGGLEQLYGRRQAVRRHPDAGQ